MQPVVVAAKQRVVPEEVYAPAWARIGGGVSDPGAETEPSVAAMFTPLTVPRVVSVDAADGVALADPQGRPVRTVVTAVVVVHAGLALAAVVAVATPVVAEPVARRVTPLPVTFWV